MQALECGYDILLEKPISPDPRECVQIEQRATELGRTITVCHVLRYTNFFGTLKQIIDSGELGKVVAIKHSENIGNFHMAHSFVRGNWRNDLLSSPIILQKSCHDLDILLWLTGKHCTRVAAFGSLSYFRECNAPEGSAERCLNCAVAESCRCVRRGRICAAVRVP
jgi:predicted dehydrogenase